MFEIDTIHTYGFSGYLCGFRFALFFNDGDFSYFDEDGDFNMVENSGSKSDFQRIANRLFTAEEALKNIFTFVDNNISKSFEEYPFLKDILNLWSIAYTMGGDMDSRIRKFVDLLKYTPIWCEDKDEFKKKLCGMYHGVQNIYEKKDSELFNIVDNVEFKHYLAIVATIVLRRAACVLYGNDVGHEHIVTFLESVLTGCLVRIEDDVVVQKIQVVEDLNSTHWIVKKYRARKLLDEKRRLQHTVPMMSSNFAAALKTRIYRC
jgi:hypothetical protein